MSKKLAICVPHYRRKEHLDTFIPHMEDFMKKYHPDIEFKIFIANQIEPDTVLRFNLVIIVILQTTHNILQFI